MEVISAYAGRTTKHTWLEWDGNAMVGKVIQLPSRDQITEPIKEQLIVELYSK
jgi:small subunit ribosomal protein S4